MRIFDKEMKNELFDVDLERGCLDTGELIHYVDEYIDENGNTILGHQEPEKIYIYCKYPDETLKQKGLYEYSEEELEEIRRKEHEEELLMQYWSLQRQLNASDYKVLKYYEGLISEEEFNEAKTYREGLREQIRPIMEQLDEEEIEY